MENEVGENNTESKATELRLKVESLKKELHECRAELTKFQKQLKQSERLQKTTESYNEDLRKQVDQLSAEIHERKKKDKDRVDSVTQTEEYEWTETDYYNYYYGGYSQNPDVSDTQEGLNTVAAVDVADGSEAAEVSTPNEVAVADADADANPKPEGSVAVTTEESDAGSIADILRATAEEAMTQTGFVFDETTGLYYDHSTGFYYDSASQLYYDANTGIYYCYDAESGRYQFHSKIEVTAAQTAAEPCRDKITEKKSRKLKKGSKKTSHQDDKVFQFDEVKLEEETDWVEKQTTKRISESRKLKRKSRSPDVRRKVSSKHREEREKSSSKRKKQKTASHDDIKGRSKKKSKKTKSKKQKKKKKSPARSDDSEEDSEPEEGEITESEKEEWESTPSFSSSSSSSSKESPESEMETQSHEVKDIWPPCVRVTVVRSPVMQVGTLFIITADSSATIGREKDMDHAIRIPEMGVSKFHVEVYFDQEQQGYMLVDQGSQNGTVINGNRILQPKTKCEPHALMHGDEVKMGETVLSFHIHSGTDTCDGCEPGQVMAHLSKHRREENTGPTLTKEDKEALRQKELKQMKAKYGLQSSEYEEAKSLKNPRYQDRAESRRQTVGSEGVFQRDDAPASVHQEISEVNKGRKMLEKMGWKKGEGLGKEGTGMKNPIELKIRKSQSGLGAGATMSVDGASMTRSKSQKNWEKARERFADSCQPDVQSPKTQKNKAWVKGEEAETTNTQAGVDTDGHS
ncbi:angiogenic factor with G patch and FHA domains 1 isoform X1 [Cottoperca gobio]|uniref:Angiogenic factor with G patch and FHA domains 1 n=1 Tax=Cottoperca gobio TaxID=56716 RepID=A0A6J2PN52_COTGO|nr:angiogenic factor with G patch and FHA domains 1 isoform X1 [Cottoperca gobio]XP_029286759.1 angiogenic factor with G patch and FHA domains 1 isoform X1 [Cottoperca gobio]XP_029286760.1 angiogenic factor with G patch and FHA domains 1 isoform X1 [Cottoperca gobio]XP_029286761.1 angiogenic factor with G patch and FHA domains 1 isoform X1 [Cottoperca gobio]XP_029286762.1 angiogenic factor with G patch and FHA domains 1 isoform X1 [Cottoperca gobio]XP_029286763.1 angiogenic factor with G patch